MEKQIIEYISVLEMAKNHYRNISHKNKGINNEMQYFFEGQAVCCEKTINDLRKLLGIKICELDDKPCSGGLCINCNRFNISEISEENKYDNGGYNNGRK